MEMLANMEAFSQVARGFCGWCEGENLGPEPEVAAAAWLCRLYAAALALPRTESRNSEDQPDLPAIEFARAKSNLAQFNGYYYREYFDPHPLLDDASVMGDVGDDLLDTYADVRRGQYLFERGEPGPALWHWSFLHRIHWGRHAVGAVFALHCLSISRRE